MCCKICIVCLKRNEEEAEEAHFVNKHVTRTRTCVEQGELWSNKIVAVILLEETKVVKIYLCIFL